MAQPSPSIPTDQRRSEAPGPRGSADAAGRGAMRVASGILLSRVLGLVRERVFAHYFGSSVAAAAFRAAQRIPNFLQNLLGEGVLSASFIPVYAQLLAKGDEEEADELASTIFALLGVLVAALVAVGIAFTPLFVDTIASGFHGESRELTIQLLRIVFPGTGLLVMSAWCLGILNSHRRFFLSYAAPVMWNIAQIAVMVAIGGKTAPEALARWLSWATVFGSGLQFAIQLPVVLRLVRRFRPTLSLRLQSVRQVIRSFGPVVLGRGVVQVSAYVDMAYASFISARAFAVLGYAQMLYLIPVSLFGMSVSAAALPEMARERGTPEEVGRALQERINRGATRIAFFVVPSACALFALGDVVGATLLRTGRFGHADVRFLWYVLMGATVGLTATTLGRLYSSAFYALKDTRTPLWFAAIRVALSAGLAYFSALHLPAMLGLPVELGAAGLTTTSGMCAWLEYALLRRTLRGRIGPSGARFADLMKLWLAASLSAGVGVAVKVALVARWGAAPGGEQEWQGQFLPFPALNPVAAGALILGTFGVAYFAIAYAMGFAQARAVVNRVLRRRGDAV